MSAFVLVLRKDNHWKPLGAFTSEDKAKEILGELQARKLPVRLWTVPLDEIVIEDFSYVRAKRLLPGRYMEYEELWGVEGLKWRDGSGESRIMQADPFKGASGITATAATRERVDELIEDRMEEVPFVQPVSLPYTGPVDERTGKPPVKNYAKKHPPLNAD